MDATQIREWLWTCLNDEEKATVEELRSSSETYARHPVVSLLYGDLKNLQRQLFTIEFAVSALRTRNKEWKLTSDMRRRLLDSHIGNSSASIAEIKAGGFLSHIFPSTKFIPRQQDVRTADFSVTQNAQTVFVEVHSKALSDQTQDNLTEFYQGMRDGTAGSAVDGIRVGSMPIEPFTGKKKGTAMTDAASKLSHIKVKSQQLTANDPGVIWLDFEPWVFPPIIEARDSLPMYSRAGGDVFTGRLWTAVYGGRGFPLLHAYPDRPVEFMQNPGMFEQHNISAVIASFEYKTVLLENPGAKEVLPDWFRTQLFNIRNFCIQYSVCNAEPGLASLLVDIKKRYIEAVAKLPITPL